MLPLWVNAQPELLEGLLVHVGLWRCARAASVLLSEQVGPVCIVIWLAVLRFTPSTKVRNKWLAETLQGNVLLTNNIHLAGVGPGALADGPVCGPYTAAVGHGIEIGDEQAAVIGLRCLDAHPVLIISTFVRRDVLGTYELRF